MKQKKFKKSFIHLLCMVTMIAGLVLTGFATHSMAAETDTGSGEEGDTEIQNQVVLKISGDIKGGNNLIYLETYDEKNNEWVKSSATESRPENVEYYELTFDVASGAKFKIINKAASVVINNVTGAGESEGIYTLQDTTATIDISTTVPEGDIWIGDNGYVIGNYTKDTFMALTQDELISNNNLYIGYDASERTIHDASASNVNVSFEIITDVKNIVVEDVERVTGSERSTLTFTSRTSIDIGKASTKITGDLSNALNYPKNLKLVGMNFWAKSWEGGSLNIESGSNAVFDTLGDLDKFIVKNGSYATVGDEERVIPSQGENDEKLISINVNEFQTVYSSVVTAPNLSINSNGNIEIGYGSSDYTYSCKLRHIQGKGTLNVTSSGNLDTYTIGNVDGDFTITYSGKVTVVGECNITVGSFYAGGISSLDAISVKVTSTGDVMCCQSSTVKLAAIEKADNLTVTDSGILNVKYIGNLADVIVNNGSSLMLSDESEHKATWKSLAADSGGKIDAPNLDLTVTDDATFKHSSFTLKALTVGGNLVAMESVVLTLKTIGNIGGAVSVYYGGKINVENECIATWKSILINSGGTITAPDLSLTVTEGATFQGVETIFKYITMGGDLNISNTGMLKVNNIGNMGNIILKNGGKIIVEGTSDDYVTWTSIDAQSGSSISAPGMRVKITGNLAAISGVTLTFKELSSKNIQAELGSTITVETIGNMDEINLNYGGILKITGPLNDKLTWKTVSLASGGKIIGLSTKNTDVSINELTITDTQVYMPYISITCDVLNLSGELLANNITCAKFIQTSKAYSYFECNKLTITDLESILYKGVANNIEIVNGDITDVLGERIKPYNITSGYAYTYNETEDKYDVTWGERTGEIIKSNDEINGPVQLFEQYEIKNVSYPEKVIYTGNAVSEPTEEEFQLMNHARIDSNWRFELIFEWYDANDNLLEELPSECGIYTLRAILDGTKLCLGTSIDVKVVIKKASEVTDIASPVVTDKTCSTIILETKEGYEYSLDGENWQDSNELKGLENGKEYTIYQRLKETDEYCASEYATITYTFEAGEHEFSDEYTVDRPATSKEEGIKSRHCKHCDEVTDITVIPKLKTGWKNIDGKWYYLDADGVVLTSKWIRTNNKWYYLDKDGVMVTSKWIRTNNKWYYLDKDGVMVTSKWIRTNNKWYYLDKDGVMQTSKWIAGKYYVKADGTMAVSEWVDNDRYYVGSDGKWIKNYKN